MEGSALHAAKRHLGVGAGRAFWQIDDHEQFGRYQRPLGPVRQAGRVRDQTRFSSCQAADHFTIGAAAQDDGRVRRTGSGHGLLEPHRHRKHTDEHSDNARNAHERREH